MFYRCDTTRSSRSELEKSSLIFSSFATVTVSLLAFNVKKAKKFKRDKDLQKFSYIALLQSEKPGKGAESRQFCFNKTVYLEKFGSSYELFHNKIEFQIKKCMILKKTFFPYTGGTDGFFPLQKLTVFVSIRLFVYLF